MTSIQIFSLVVGVIGLVIIVSTVVEFVKELNRPYEAPRPHGRGCVCRRCKSALPPKKKRSLYY